MIEYFVVAPHIEIASGLIALTPGQAKAREHALRETDRPGVYIPVLPLGFRRDEVISVSVPLHPSQAVPTGSSDQTDDDSDPNGPTVIPLAPLDPVDAAQSESETDDPDNPTEESGHPSGDDSAVDEAGDESPLEPVDAAPPAGKMYARTLAESLQLSITQTRALLLERYDLSIASGNALIDGDLFDRVVDEITAERHSTGESESASDVQ